MSVEISSEALDQLVAKLIEGQAEGAEDLVRSFGAETRLIVYGSLVPGGANHGELAGLEGTWSQGYVTGRLVQLGWGAEIGYPALVWKADGERVPAHLFESRELPAHWERLDRFEGDSYRRVPVPFHGEDGELSVGQIYLFRS